MHIFNYDILFATEVYQTYLGCNSKREKWNHVVMNFKKFVKLAWRPINQYTKVFTVFKGYQHNI